MSDSSRQFPEWESFYQDSEVETMPWFYPDLDPDLARALDGLGLQSGRALDLGTGPGTQAIGLTNRGFAVTATDLSEAAIRKAREFDLSRTTEQPPTIDWRQDDILATGLDKRFDLIFDRGCFHVLAPEQRATYVETVTNLLEPGGYLFLKCFSHLQPGEIGPYHFSPELIEQIFAARLTICSIQETVYQGQLETLPQALFCTLKKPN